MCAGSMVSEPYDQGMERLRANLLTTDLFIAGHVVFVGEVRNACKISSQKTLSKRHRHKNNYKMNIAEVGCDNVGLTN